MRNGISVFVHAPCAPGKAGLSGLEVAIKFCPFCAFDPTAVHVRVILA